MRRWISAVMVLGLAACGLPLAQGDAQLPDICTEQPAVTVPGAPVGAPSSLDVAESYPLTDQISQFAGDGGTALTELTVTSLTLKVASGVTDFRFLDSVALTVTDPDAGSPDLVLFNYAKDPNATASDTLNLPPADAVNLLPLLKANALQGKVSLHGTLPTSDWSFIARPCFSAKAHLKF